MPADDAAFDFDEAVFEAADFDVAAAPFFAPVVRVEADVEAAAFDEGRDEAFADDAAVWLEERFDFAADFAALAVFALVLLRCVVRDADGFFGADDAARRSLIAPSPA